MRFETLTHRERMIRMVEQNCRWHTMFAIWPREVVVDGRAYKVWLERVGRRGRYSRGGYEGSGPSIMHWEYCFADEVTVRALKDNDMRDVDGQVIDIATYF